MKPKSWTYSESFLIKVLVVVAAVSQLACSPALISVLGSSSLTKIFQFPTWESQLGSGAGTQALYNSGMGGNGNVLVDLQGNTTICGATTGQIGSHFPYSPNAGAQDVYLARFNKSGILQWTVEISAGAGTTTSINGCINDGLSDGYTYLAAGSSSDYHSTFAGFTLFGAVGTGTNSLLFKIDQNGNIIFGIQISAANQSASVNGAAFDSSGNIAFIGSTPGLLLTGSSISASSGSSSNNGFVMKISATATSPVTPVWTDVIGGGSFSNTQPQTIVFDSSNNAYVVGTTNGLVATTPVDYGGINGMDIFVESISPAGVPNWPALQFGDDNNNFLGSSGPCSGGGSNNPGLLLDSSGNAYVWGPACATSVTTGLTPVGGAGFSSGGDLFAAKITNTGVLGWGIRIQCGAADSNCQSRYPNGNQGGQGGLFISNSNIYITGQTTGVITPNSDGTVQGNPMYFTSNIFFLTLNSAGVIQTELQYGNGPMTNLNVQNAVVDSSGHLIVGGTIGGSTLLGSTEYGTLGSTDAFLISFNAAENPVWIDQFGGGGSAIIQNLSLQLDSRGQAVVTASYTPGTGGNPIFGTGSFSTTLFGNVGGMTSTDGIIFQVAPGTGNLNWSAQMGAGTSNNMNLNSVAMGPTGIYVLGSISNASGVTGGTGTLYGGASGFQNMFLAGISVLGPK